ncbi:hypothetical protein PV08_03803 [Exophiala spinifera]|uniref:GED domain-containing protein n=1 Tax=Exophiala spinifera TaxID=91928 RepID=A0A0D2BDD4_9EURO|nr:uncharacterized protein PV08_03803 [Exophiala spinifera]KIW16615.1 hypothetical protein PV08_03803 [Exophiala spinifera]
MGIRTDTSSGEGTVFSEDVLKIEICGPNEDYLTVIDVPGLFRTPTEGITTREDVQLVRNMVQKYIKNDRTIILAVLPSNVDIATQEILTLAEDYDKAGERTLGVLTKPDLVKEHNAQVGICNIVSGKKRPLTLGYYVVRSRGADDDDDFNHADGEKMFLKTPWNQLPKNRLGVPALKARLSELLSQITQKGFPELRKEVNKQLADCRTELEGLGPSRQTERDQRLFLSSLARSFQDTVHAAMNAYYSSQAIFEQREELRLITYVVNLTEIFGDDIARKGHVRSFEGHSRLSDDDEESSESEESDSRAEAHAIEGPDFLQDIDLDEFDVLDSIIIKDCDVDDPMPGIMDWTEDIYLRTRAIELGTFSGIILSSAFKEQSGNWELLTKSYISHVVVVIHRFMVLTLNALCTDAQLREELWNCIIDEVLERYKAAMDQAMFLVSLERNRRPYTVNHYFNDNLQIARGNRKADMLKPKSRREITQGYNRQAITSENLIVNLSDVRATTRSKGNLEYIKEEIHDILWSYYKVARKRFVDNVYQQAVDHCLLTGPKSPLAVFTQEWVISLDSEKLARITQELSVTRARREVLTRKRQDLETAVRILRN